MEQPIGAGGGTEDTVFDASQYAFFGNHVVDEVELGGIDDDEIGSTASASAAANPFFDDHLEQDYILSQNEGHFVQTPSVVNDLASNLSEIELINLREDSISVGGVTSSKNSFVLPWKEDDSNGWSGQQFFDSERTVNGRVWSSESFSSFSHPVESQSLHRTASYPQQPPVPLQSISGDPRAVPGSLTSHPPMSRDPYLLNFHEQHMSKSFIPEISALSSPNISSFNTQFLGSEANRASQFNGNPLSLAPIAQKVSSQRGNQDGSFTSENTPLFRSSLQQYPPQNGAMNQFSVHQQQSHQLIRPPGHLAGMQVLSRNSHAYTAPNMASPGWGVQHQMPIHAGRQSAHNYQQSYVSAGHRKESWWPSHRSKYMTVDELDNILRMQLAATHSNDPYVDDYYHQASLSKKANGARLKRHFCPAILRDGHPGARANTETHAFLQVEALGRVPFSSIRRPRPLIEIDSPSSTSLVCSVQNGEEKSLDHEPMLAARVAIENGMDLLLDVDDIDRFLQFNFNQLQDAGTHLKRKRQDLLQEVAKSLHLVDMLSSKFQNPGFISEDELVFLRMVSLPKGRKFLMCYIQHLLPGDDLLRLVLMAILRHLRFLFDCPPKDFRSAEITSKLARVVASSFAGLDLGALGDCLAAVVCSTEQPQFRPIGSLAGDGTSIILTSMLQRATDLLTDPRAIDICKVGDRALWQASFDDFFGILTMYCMRKYDSVMQTLLVRNTMGSAFISPDAAEAISKEMPVDLLRASLPHTNEKQRKILLEFAQRAMPV